MDKVIDNGFCVGCGNCVSVNKTRYALNTDQVIEIKSRPSENTPKILAENQLLEAVCPFSGTSEDEDGLSASLYGKSSYHDTDLGRYEALYAGWDNDESARVSSSSGGLTSFLVAKLLRERVCDRAIVVAYDAESDNGISYRIVSRSEELRESRQSKYALASYASVLDEIRDDLTYVFVGIPCHVKALRLLAKTDGRLQKNIKYMVAVFCGHQKTYAFSQYIAWRMSVEPQHLQALQYRLKKPGHRSDDYYYSAITSDGKRHEERAKSLKWLDWGIGLFKLKACDFCDDVAAETADIVLGDAWLRDYTSDYRGANIVIVRHPKLNQLLRHSVDHKEISLFETTRDMIVRAQSGSFRHRKEGLLSRIRHYQKLGLWFPARRASLAENYKEAYRRRKTYILRHEIAIASHVNFREALRTNSLSVFDREMSSLIGRYQKESRTLPGMIRALLKRGKARWFKS
ncbi:Coenzyme F420 hydrogenase/dehydrogenase, beta subunit C-terminal domain [Cupriavidus necator]